MKGWFIFDRVCANIVTTSSLRGDGGWGKLRSHAMNTKPVPSRKAGGFSLIELLSVVAVIALMMSLIAPAVSGFSSTAGRRGAVNTLMNTFEQARVKALESGATVYVVFWRRVFPEHDSVMVVSEPQDPTNPYNSLTRWIKLPKGILLHQPALGQSLLSATVPANIFDPSRMPNSFTLGSGEFINILAFNETGVVGFPTSKPYRKLIVSEGVRGAGGTEALISQKKQTSGGFEIISISPYTGRAQLDVTTIQ